MPLIIAEIGQAHEGSLGIAHSYIDALADSGVHAVKFQTHIAEAESSEYEPFRVKFSYEDETRMDYWRRMQFTPDQWKGLKEHAEEVGLEFMSSPFSNAAVDLLEELGVTRYKVGSGEVSNFLLLRKIAETGKPIILSSGMSSFDELNEAINFLQPYGNELSILQCTTAYPTQPEDWGLNVINELKERFALPVGFSDHSGNIFACLAAATLGASILEFHVVFDQRMFGPDARSSLTLDQVKQLTKGVQEITAAINTRIDKTDNRRFSELKGIFEKSLAVNKSLKKGQVVAFEDLEAKKPKNKGISAALFQEVIGKTLKNDIEAWSFINESDLK